MSIKGLHFVTKKRIGKPIKHFVYAWRGGPCIMSVTGGAKPRLTPEAVAAYHNAHTRLRSPQTPTLGALATRWRGSPEWAAFAPDTRKQWGYKLADIQAKWGDVPLEIFDDRRMRGKVVDWRDTMANTPRKADISITVLRQLLSYGRLRASLSLNVAEGIPQLYKGGNRAAIIWEPTERWVMEFGLSVPVSDAFRLACLTGFRRAELATAPRRAIGQHAIVWQTQKSGRRATVTVPMIEPLRAFLAEIKDRLRQPGVDTILVNSRGLSWTPDGLDSSFGDERDRIGFDKHLHDCRGTCATELMEAGLTDAQIAGILGWSLNRVADIRRIYVDQERTVVAIGDAISRRAVNQSVNR